MTILVDRISEEEIKKPTPPEPLSSAAQELVRYGLRVLAGHEDEDTSGARRPCDMEA
ncbi:hypothetical protein [Rhizobium leguminosarum]|uniref:hypothetical protein n=1 Tax=Rhizobium leguminosarum TaxID=384 RepID=UPI00144294B6|nr:hypothetical protein [Rhizobium leguminosarum]MBY5869328.1 hypothetical protein [Rhizobium leguminosarum]